MIRGERLRYNVGLVNRGIAAWNGKIIMGTLDARLVAIDAKTGKEAWSTDTVPESLGLGEMAKHYSITMAPRVAKGKVFIGASGGEFGVRGWIAAFDAETGKEVWRFWTVPGRSGERVREQGVGEGRENLERRVVEGRRRRRHRVGCGGLRSGDRSAVLRHRQCLAVECARTRAERSATICIPPRSSR